VNRRALTGRRCKTGRKVESLEDWLHTDPRWDGLDRVVGWLRIRTPSYRTGSEPNRSCEKGLSSQVRDHLDMLERLADVCEEQGRKGEATYLIRPKTVDH
jgi:hypothetical protein